MREFKYHSYYKNHYISQHDPSKPFKCRKCHYTFLTERWLIVHMRTHIAAGDLMPLAGGPAAAAATQGAADAGAVDSFDSSLDGSVERRKGARGFDCIPTFRPALPDRRSRRPSRYRRPARAWSMRPPSVDR